MDFPIFHLDWVGDRFLFVIIAITHTVINHGLAIGLVPIISIMEFMGMKNKNPEWDNLAFKLMKVVFIITTTVGAMTGVGIWLAASLVNPNSIASMIRVFFSAWLFEWIIFVTEVTLVMFYFLTWKKWINEKKEKHFALGYGLTMFSWVTMAIIVAILGFMMDPGDWSAQKNFMYGFLNPLYLPQLAFRTFLALLLGGSIALFLTHFFTHKESEIRSKAVKFLSVWILIATPFCLVSGLWYWNNIPEAMQANVSVALGTQQYQDWFELIYKVLIGGCGFAVLTSLVYLVKPKLKYSFLLSSVLVLWLAASLGMFERVREFIRKPYIIRNYMYANGYKVEDYPLLQKEGVLKYADFVSTRTITADNNVEAGKNVFLLTCSQCHTINGTNAISTNLNKMYGKDKPWPAKPMQQYIRNMHNARTYMPPFPGNNQEIEALVTYFKVIQYQPDPKINRYGFLKTSISPEQNHAMLEVMRSHETGKCLGSDSSEGSTK